MALYHFQTITFVQDNPLAWRGPDLDAEFVQGDFLEIYFDSASLSFEVYFNGDNNTGTPVVAGDTLSKAYIGPELFGTFFSEIIYLKTVDTPGYCDSGDFHSFRQGNDPQFGGGDFPWVSYAVEVNANQCSGNVVVADLQWEGLPTVLNASTLTSNDGSITYNATSTNTPIRYVISTNPFLTVIGTGQDTCVFTGLAPGYYTVYAADAAGFIIPYSFSIFAIDTSIPDPPQVICNLAVSGSPTISEDTGTENGSITYTAVSSHPIQYALRHFVYGDGNGQASSTFSNLAYGDYRLYAVDNQGCVAFYDFTIPLNDTPATPPAEAPVTNIRYQVNFKDLNRESQRINIIKKDYTGSVEEINASGTPLVYSCRLEGEDDKYYYLAAGEIAIGLDSETSFKFQDIFQGDINRYRINYYRNGQLTFVGKIFPESYSEPYTQGGGAGYPITIKATDGLVELGEIPFVDNQGTRYAGVDKQIHCIARALQKVGFNLNIRCGINLYEENMDQGDDDDPLDQAYVDYSSYYQEDEPLSCLEVIKRNLEPYAATICQWGGYWWIVRREEFIAPWDFREFSPNGTYLSNGTYNSVAERGSFGKLEWMNQDATIDMVLPRGFVEVSYSQGLKSLIPNSDFSLVSYGGSSSIDLSGFVFAQADDTVAQTGFAKAEGDNNVALVIKGTGKCFLRTQPETEVKMFATDLLKFGYRYKTEEYITSFRYQKIKLQIQYGGHFLRVDGSWSSTEHTMVIYETDFGKFKDLEILAPQADPDNVAGNFLTCTYYSSWILDHEFDTAVELRAKVTVDLPIGSKSEVGSGSGIFYYELEETSDADDGVNVIEPDDYDGGTNPVKWVLKQQATQNFAFGRETVPYGKLTIDRIVQEYQPGGSELTDLEVTNKAPKNSKRVFKKEIYHGSIVSNNYTLFTFGLNITTGQSNFIGVSVPNPNNHLTTRNYLRDESGVGLINWTRDAVEELTTLQRILAASYVAQYKTASRRITSSLSSLGTGHKITPLSILAEDDDFYLPMGFSVDIRQCSTKGEFIEEKDITSGGTSTGGGTRTFNDTFNLTFA